MRSDLTLGAWLAGAVLLHLVAASYAPRLGLPEIGQFYGVILAYAVPASLGLCLAGWLRPWRAAGFCVLVAAAHAVAVVAAISTTPTVGLSAAMMMRSGALAGVLGAALSLFGLIGLRGAAPAPRAFGLAALFSAILALGGLLLVPALDAPSFPKELALPLILYLPWQIVFSVAVVLISRAGLRPSPEPARS